MKIVPPSKNIATIRCKAEVVSIGSWLIVILPKSASVPLPSRGMCVAAVTIDGFQCEVALEPDGKGSHWFRVEKPLLTATKIMKGDMVNLVVQPLKDWPEPKIPEDLQKALVGAPLAYSLWKDITPMARWDWIRWIRSTKQADTRAKRITVACSKLKSGSRRPCCFNRSVCTEMAVSERGVLKDPT